MEVPSLNPSTFSYLFASAAYLFPNYHNYIPQNYVHWTQTPESHIYSADIPGVRKEEIRVELEDSRYLIIRTESSSSSSSSESSTVEPHRRFNRKFRLPDQVDLNGISAEYVDGVLTVTVPRLFVRRGFYVDPNDRPETVHLLARAA